MLDYVAELAKAAGVSDRVVVIHADLGRVEWQGTRELAAEQAAHYGFRFEVVRREKGDLLDQIQARGMFPSSTARYCTSDQKRDQVAKEIVRLTDEKWAGAPVRILNCMGFRKEESSARAKRPVSIEDKRLCNGKRVVVTWLPIHDWTVAQVWARIKASGVPHHKAYDLGMPRLSCCFCIFAPPAALMLAGKHNPELLEEYVQVERSTGHDFRMGFKIESIQQRLAAGEQAGPIQNWTM